MKLLITSLFLVLCSVLNSQDTTFVKSYYGGSTIKIPSGKIWEVQKAFISSGDGYNIQISLTNFKRTYNSGEELSIPYYIAEMELLSNRSMVSYFLTIRQRNDDE